jgi:hypothetical protein
MTVIEGPPKNEENEPSHILYLYKPPLVSSAPNRREELYLPSLKNIHPQETDIQTAVGMFVAEIKKSGVLNNQNLSEISAIPLPPDYFENIEHKPLRSEMLGLSPDGQMVAIHLATIWKQYGGSDVDESICLFYPDLFPGAPSFSALLKEFQELVKQLSHKDAELIDHFYQVACAANSPHVILDLIP